MSAHARLAPSAAHMWGPGGCPAYPRMAALYPPAETEETQEGTAAHWVVSSMLLSNTVPRVDDVAPNGVAVTADMIDGAQAIVSDTWALVRSEPGVRWHVETRVEMPGIHQDNWGTPDIFGYVPSRNLLFVKDYKYGHRYVDAFRNVQLVDYLDGAANYLGLDLAKVNVSLGIYQPRCFSHRGASVNIWETHGSALLPIVDALRHAALETDKPDAPMSTHDGCRDCPARLSCPAALQTIATLAEFAYQGVPHDLSDADCARVLTLLDGAIDRLNGSWEALSARVEAAARAGRPAPGWELKPGTTKDEWAVPLEVIKLLGASIKKPLTKEVPLTPRQAQQAGVPETVVKDLSKTKSPPLKLSRVTGAEAARAFSTGGT